MRGGIGQLRHRVQIQAPTDTRDAFGGNTRTWATIATVWGSVEPLEGDELTEAQQVNARATVRIRIRAYPGLTSKHRIILAE